MYIAYIFIASKSRTLVFRFKKNCFNLIKITSNPNIQNFQMPSSFKQIMINSYKFQIDKLLIIKPTIILPKFNSE